MNGQRKDRARNRKAILAAAEKLLAKDGQATLTEIALEAGVSPATVYRQFSDRSQLLSTLMERQLEQLETTVGSWTLDGGSFERLLRLMAKEQARYQGVIAEVRRGAVEPAQIEVLTWRTAELFSAALAEAKKEETVSKGMTTEDVIVLMRMLDGLIAGESTRTARERVASQGVVILLDGIRP
jgi:AcrR family transcriptional regulator